MAKQRWSIRRRLFSRCVLAGLFLVAGTWFVFSTLHGSVILLREVQAGEPVNPASLMVLTDAATHRFGIKEQYEVLHILQQYGYRGDAIAVLEVMVRDYRDQLALRLQLADALTADGQFARAHHHYEFLLQELDR